MFEMVKPATVTVFVLFFLVLLFSKCINGSSYKSLDVRGAAYAGSQVCSSCHKNIFDSWSHTAHFRTSSLFRQWPQNHFRENSFGFNDSVRVSIVKTDSGIVQAEYLRGKPVLVKPFQLTIGSGDQAASFGYWSNGKVYQLPLTYFASIRGWANSPGFPSSEPYFYRTILIGCFECHASFASEVADQTEGLKSLHINSSSIIYGIDCERCHGPAADHVRFHTQNPSEKLPKYIATWNSLSRHQKLDACAVCHSGNDRALQTSTFDFKPGDTLANYYFPFSSESSEPDVHGKQMQLLAASRCFLMSQEMECTTCHSQHQPSNHDAVVRSAPCMNCHSQGAHVDCRVASKPSSPLNNNCIDCHMPLLPSKKIQIQVETRQVATDYLLRTHRIAIYPEVSKKILQQQEKQ
jgi:hypothetical protein